MGKINNNNNKKQSFCDAMRVSGGNGQSQCAYHSLHCINSIAHPAEFESQLTLVILLHEKLLQIGWLGAVVSQLNLKYKPNAGSSINK